MLFEVDQIAQAEHRTRSDLIRESLRQYINKHRKEFISNQVGRDATGKPYVIDERTEAPSVAPFATNNGGGNV